MNGCSTESMSFHRIPVDMDIDRRFSGIASVYSRHLDGFSLGRSVHSGGQAVRRLMEESGILLSHVRQLMMMAAGVCVRMCVWMDYGRGRRYSARRRYVNWRQRCLGLRCVEAMAMTCYQAVMAAPAAGRGMTVMMMPEDDPREGHGSLMMLRRAVRVMRLRDHVVTRGWCVCGARMVMTAGRRMVIRIIGAAAVVIVIVVILLLRLPLAVLLVLHPTILKPDLDLAFGQI